MKKLKLTSGEISDLTLSLGTMLHAGTDTADSLYLLEEGTEEPELKKLLRNMAEMADEGLPLSEIIRRQECFPGYVAGLVQVGEKTGRTEESLNALSEYYEGQDRLGKQLRNAILYPAILLVIMLAVLVVLVVYVLPVFNDVYAQLGTTLTGVSGGLLAIGQKLKNIMPSLLIILTVVVMFIAAFASSSSFREDLLSAWYRKSREKGIPWQIASARFAQALEMGISSGLPEEQTVRLAGDLLSDFPYAREHCERCASLLEEGSGLSDALKQTGFVPAAECRMLQAAMRSGNGELAVQKIARRLSETSEVRIQNTVAGIEPAMVIAGSVLVGLILLCVMLPLMHIMSAIG